MDKDKKLKVVLEIGQVLANNNLTYREANECLAESIEEIELSMQEQIFQIDTDQPEEKAATNNEAVAGTTTLAEVIRFFDSTKKITRNATKDRCTQDQFERGEHLEQGNKDTSGTVTIDLKALQEIINFHHDLLKNLSFAVLELARLSGQMTEENSTD